MIQASTKNAPKRRNENLVREKVLLKALAFELTTDESTQRLLRKLMVSITMYTYIGNPGKYPGCPLTTKCRQKSSLPSV